jgi:hypothetical protein
MSSEGFSPQPKKKPEEQASLQMTRRGFLRFASDAVIAGVARGNGIETISSTPSMENIPSEKELIETFQILRGERSCRERRKHSDEKGVYLWELEFKIEGGTAEFGYMREGEYKVGGSADKTKIFITYFDEDGMPEGGTDVAEYKEGKWVIDTEFLKNI